jgi:hypothetical protein
MSATPPAVRDYQIEIHVRDSLDAEAHKQFTLKARLPLAVQIDRSISRDAQDLLAQVASDCLVSPDELKPSPDLPLLKCIDCRVGSGLIALEVRSGDQHRIWTDSVVKEGNDWLARGAQNVCFGGLGLERQLSTRR